MKKLSLVMIVKNEEKTLERCLKSCADLVNEIVLVDTGSTDKTLEIAKKFNAQIFHYNWDNNFSNARNFAIKNSTGDFNLILDADEYITNINKNELKIFMNTQNTIAKIKRIDFFNSDIGVKKSVCLISRLAPKGVFFEGSIHEQLDPKLPRTFVNIEVEHDGYLFQDKFDRNIDLILKELENNKNDPYMLYQAGKTYFVNKSYTKAQRYLEKYLDVSSCNTDDFYPDAVISYIYTSLNSKNFEKCLKIVEHNKLILNNRCDFWFSCGVFYMTMIKHNPRKYGKMLEEIKKSYLKAIEIGEPPNFDGVIGTGTFSAYHNLAVYFEVIGDMENAQKYYELEKTHS